MMGDQGTMANAGTKEEGFYITFCMGACHSLPGPAGGKDQEILATCILAWELD
jgi:hypothetical protein